MRKSGRGRKTNPVLSFLTFVALYFVIGVLLTAPVFLLYKFNYLSYSNFNYIGNAMSLISLSIAVFVYLTFYKKMNLKNVVKELRLTRKTLTFKNIFLGIGIFLLILLGEIVVGLISQATNTKVNTNIGILLTGAPLWFLIFLTTIEPINEEILFRGLMVPRFGIVISALFFGVLHAGYNSTFGIEVIAAFVFGLIAGYFFKRTNSLYPSIVAHILVNSLSLIAFIYGGIGAS